LRYAPSAQGAGGADGKEFKNEEGTLEEMVKKAEGTGKTAFQTVLGTITWTKHDDKATLFYKGIPGGIPGKVIEKDGGGTKRWFSNKTSQYYDDYEPRFIVSVAVSDATGREYATIFDDIAPKLLRVSAKEVEKWRVAGDQKSVERVFGNLLGQRFVFKLRAKEETDQNAELRVRTVVSAADEPNYSRESAKLITKIRALSA